MDKTQAVGEYKDSSLQCLCYEHIAVWQRYMDYIYRTGDKSNTFHMISIRCILDISRQEKASDAGVLSRAGVPNMYGRMYTMLRQHRRQWLGHVRRMEDSRILKYILYGKLAMGDENHRSPSPAI